MTVHSDWNEGTCLTGGWKHWDCSIKRTEGSGAILAVGRNAWWKDIRKTAKFSSVVSSKRGKGYNMFLFKLKKKLFSCEAVKQWCRLPNEAVEYLSQNKYNPDDAALCSLPWLALLPAGHWTRHSQSPFHLNCPNSVISFYSSVILKLASSSY